MLFVLEAVTAIEGGCVGGGELLKDLRSILPPPKEAATGFSQDMWRICSFCTFLLLSLLHELVFLSNDDDGSSSWKVTWLWDFFISVVAPAWTNFQEVSLVA